MNNNVDLSLSRHQKKEGKPVVIKVLFACLILFIAVLSASCANYAAAETETIQPKIKPTTIPHTIENRNNCRACHDVKVVFEGVPKLPEDHGQRPSDVCTACHLPITSEDG